MSSKCENVGVWQMLPDSIPPKDGHGMWSPLVWLALSDGRVIPGHCLHKRPEATYSAPVHDWFSDGDEKGSVRDLVIAWMPFTVPSHPTIVS